MDTQEPDNKTQSSQALQLPDGFHEALFEYNPCQTIVVDETGGIITCNRAKRLSSDRLPGDGDVIFKDYAARYTNADMFTEFVECIKAGETKKFPELKYVDGKHFSVTISPFPGGAIIITEDITAEKEAEQELKDANAHLHEKDRLKTAFVTTVSHELRTSLCVLKNTISNVTAQRFGWINRKLKDKFHVANSSVDRLAQVIDDFIEMSEIETGSVQLVPESVDIRQLASELAASLASRANERDIQLTIDIPESNLTVHADRSRLSQVLRQLLDNAVKFVPDGGNVELAAKDIGDQIQINVSDNGPGIKPEDLERIFDCFGEAEVSDTTGQVSIGLGLTLARQFIEMQNGRIWAQSLPGQGADFHILLPKNA